MSEMSSLCVYLSCELGVAVSLFFYPLHRNAEHVGSRTTCRRTASSRPSSHLHIQWGKATMHWFRFRLCLVRYDGWTRNGSGSWRVVNRMFSPDARSAFVGPTLGGYLFDAIGYRMGTMVLLALELLLVSKAIVRTKVPNYYGNLEVFGRRFLTGSFLSKRFNLRIQSRSSCRMACGAPSVFFFSSRRTSYESRTHKIYG